MAKNGRFVVEINSDRSDAESQSQLARFRRAAQELGCEDDEAAFDEKLKALAPPRPKAGGAVSGSAANEPPANAGGSGGIRRAKRAGSAPRR